MRALVVAVAVTLFTIPIWAQTESGSIRGTLSSARAPLAAVEVRVKNADTGEVKTTSTSPAG